jgi:Type II intron maturase
MSALVFHQYLIFLLTAAPAIRQQYLSGVLPEYYRLAHNLSRFNRLRWVMEASLTKTLASKLKISVQQVYKKFQTVIKTEEGANKVLQVVIPREEKKPLIAQ